MKKLTRSKGWAERCRPEPEDEELAVCEHCGVKHGFVFVGRLGKLIEEGFGGLEDFSRDSKVAYYPKGGQPSSCWGEDVVWRESKAKWELGLVDQVGPANSEVDDWVPQIGLIPVKGFDAVFQTNIKDSSPTCAQWLMDPSPTALLVSFVLRRLSGRSLREGRLSA